MDQIALYQWHRPDSQVPLEDSVGALMQLKDEGKIRHLGVSNVTEEQLRQVQAMTPVVSIQNRYNVGDRSSETIVDLCEQEDLAFLPWAPIQGVDEVVAVRTRAQKYGVTTRQLVLAWLLARSPAMLVIPGTGSVSHLQDNVAAASIRLDADDVAAITDAVG